MGLHRTHYFLPKVFGLLWTGKMKSLNKELRVDFYCAKKKRMSINDDLSIVGNKRGVHNGSSDCNLFGFSTHDFSADL